jgi:hypothetical protein
MIVAREIPIGRRADWLAVGLGLGLGFDEAVDGVITGGVIAGGVIVDGVIAGA